MGERERERCRMGVLVIEQKIAVCVCVCVCGRNDYVNHLLFHLENVLVEMLLQRLVGVIDT